MKRTIALLSALVACASNYAAEISVAANISTDTVWTSDNTYILDAQVYVIDGASLTIEPGTVIKGAALVDSASALIVTRGAKIFAVGTSSDPIVFTAEADPLDGSLDESNTQLWGGVIILGAAPINSESRGTEGDLSADPQTPTVDNIEGLANSDDNTWTEFGGLDPEDNSGIFRYVSIRFGGSVIGANNEINGLTMGGVGRGTLIEFVEVFANKDDGFEWFGGTVDARYLVSAFGNDDSFDYDQGWTGRGQFWFSIGTSGVTGDAADHGGEHDGTVDFSQDHPNRGMGEIYNATYIGPGSDSGVDEGVFEINDDAGVRYYNSIFMAYAGHGVDVVDPDGRFGLTEVEDGVTRIDFRNNIWFDLGDGSAADLATATDVVSFLTSPGKNNTIEDPMLYGVSRVNDGGLDPRPMSGSPAFSNARKSVPGDGWYIPVSFQGAFGDTNWMAGWTKLSQDGYLKAPVERTSSTVYNTSVRTSLDVAAGEVVAMGLIITGDAPRMVLIRAEGPFLSDFGVANPASATSFTIFDPRTTEAVYGGRVWNGWAGEEEAAAIDAISSYVGFPSIGDDTTSAMALVSLNPGNYSIAVTNPDATGGETVISATLLDL